MEAFNLIIKKAVCFFMGALAAVMFFVCVNVGTAYGSERLAEFSGLVREVEEKPVVRESADKKSSGTVNTVKKTSNTASANTANKMKASKAENTSETKNAAVKKASVKVNDKEASEPGDEERLKALAGLAAQLPVPTGKASGSRASSQSEDKKVSPAESDEDRMAGVSALSEGDEDRMAGVSALSESDEDRMAELSALSEGEAGGELFGDQRLAALSMQSQKYEAEMERKYGPKIEDNVITDTAYESPEYSSASREVDPVRVTSVRSDQSRLDPKSSLTGRISRDGSKRTPVTAATIASGKAREAEEGQKNDSSSGSDEKDRENKQNFIEKGVTVIRDTFAKVFGGKKESSGEKSEAPSVVEEQERYEDAEKVSLGTFKLTAYDACLLCCGKTDGITASGTKAAAGRTIAVDTSVIPMGSRVLINGHVYVAEDRGSKVKGNVIDIYTNTHEEARRFGVKQAEVFLLKQK